MRSPNAPLRTAVSVGVPLALVALVILLARHDRASRQRPRDAFAGREKLVVAVPEAVAAAAAIGRADPLAEIQEAEARARRAREDLEGIGRELDERKRELELLRGEADADARRSRDELEKARQDLERQRAELEEAARDADRRLQATRAEMQAMERLQRAQLDAAAGAGVARGLGAGVVVPPGLARLDASQAAVNAQTADGLALQNRFAATEAFFEKRRMNRAARAKEAAPASTMEQIVGRAAAARVPPLDELQLDRLTGEIAWPRLLTDPVFADEVAEVERGFRERASWGGSRGHAADAALVEAIDALAGRLRENVSRYPGGKYGAARVFVDGLRSAVDEDDWDR